VPLVLVLLLLVALALPLLSWSIAGRRFWADLRGPGTRDLRAEVVARHGLSGAEADTVQTAVSRGRPVTESRLRPAATDWAGTTLTVIDEQHARHAGRDRAAAVVLGLAGLCLLAAVVLAVALDAGALVYLLVALAAGAIANLALLPVLVRRNLRRAVTANGG
jgi:Flp pilus assembly protein TadB